MATRQTKVPQLDELLYGWLEPGTDTRISGTTVAVHGPLLPLMGDRSCLREHLRRQEDT
jgi:hypothetical protein